MTTEATVPTAEDRAIYVNATYGNDDRHMVAALMAHDSDRENTTIGATLPEIAAYAGMTVAQMVSNKINAQSK